MMHHVSGGWTGAQLQERGNSASSMAALAYRSRPYSPPTRAGLDHILRVAQERNRAEGLTGLLVYDQGHFYQWLEGPTVSLARVWDSIRRDPRHHDIKLLRQESMSRRFFAGWDMRLAQRSRGPLDRVIALMDAPQELLGRLRAKPTVMADGAWDDVFTDAIIPGLRVVHPGLQQDLQSAPLYRPWHAGWRPPALWHAHREAGAELAGYLLGSDSAATARYVDALIDQGAGLEPLFHEVFEPAARWLGGLWDEDRCDEFSVTLAMGRLQIEARRLSSELPRCVPAVTVGHAVLVAQQPGEFHGLSAAMGAELFSRDGWDVSHEYPRNDKTLRNILHSKWFDVLELSSSASMSRDRRLPAMRLTIHEARAASLNPALAVIVDGRSFFERPQAYLEVGADVGCGTTTDAVPAAQLLLDAAAVRANLVIRPRAARRRRA